jgi:ABC-type nickel/cobalt efflux system permease component RcnA
MLTITWGKANVGVALGSGVSVTVDVKLAVGVALGANVTLGVTSGVNVSIGVTVCAAALGVMAVAVSADAVCWGVTVLVRLHARVMEIITRMVAKVFLIPLFYF